MVMRQVRNQYFLHASTDKKFEMTPAVTRKYTCSVVKSKAVLMLWFLAVTCSCCPYLYFGSAIMLVTYFVNFG